MKRLTVNLIILCLLLCAGCASQEKEDGLMVGVETDYAAAIMAEGEIYLKTTEPIPAEIDESAIIGYTEYYTDTFPERDGETNFNRSLGMAYARVEGGIAVLYEGEWYLCVPQQ